MALELLFRRSRSLILFCGMLAGWLVAQSQAAVPDRYVVLITIDGFPASIFWDNRASLPRLRQLAAEGAAAEGLQVSDPSVTWPNHTTLVTGVRADKHSVLYNGVLVRGGPDEPVRVDPRRDKSELVAVPTLYDLLHARGFRTAAINWPCTRNAPSLDDNFPDVPEQVRNCTPRLRQELVTERILPEGTDAAFSRLSGPARDEIWTAAAVNVIRKRKPHFMLLHLLNTDGVHHKYGPHTPASYTAVALADTYVGRVIDALEAAGIRRQTTIFVVSDHGFATATNVLQPNVVLRQAGLLKLGASNQVTYARAQIVPEGGTGMIYLNQPQTRTADLARVRELFSNLEGVSRLLAPEQYAKYGFPWPTATGGMADLVLVPKAGYAVNGTATGENAVLRVDLNVNLGYHGYLSDVPAMNGLFLASGRGIKPRLRPGLVKNVDVAPTIAHLLRQKFSGTDGAVLTEIVAQP
jgi:predicted AlkP superfamily pyrophosphatase or phosphodiesterase